MRWPRFFAAFLLSALFVQQSCAFAQAVSYHPLGTWVDPQVEAFSRWDATRLSQAARSVKSADRPQLAGMKPAGAELLIDALLRKHSLRLRGSAALARSHILRLRTTRAGMNVINGALAEAMFLERNPEWGYVRAPNAPQHDVYRWVAGRRTPFNGQIKFFEQFKPWQYAASMEKDYRAHRFFIPDDHVDAMKEYLKARAEKAAAAGNPPESTRLWRDYARLRPLGFTTDELASNREAGLRTLSPEARGGAYVSLGASLAFALGPTTWDWATGSIPATQAVYRTERAMALLGVGVGTEAVIGIVGQGALRGTVRGNIIVGTAARDR